MNQEQQQSQLKQLITKGKIQGYLTYAEVNDHLPSDIVDPEQIEDIIGMINDMGIQVYEVAPDEVSLITDSAVTTDDAEAAEVAALASVDSEFGRTTDPVRMYMREMGSVELLTRADELKIAKRIEEAEEEEEIILDLSHLDKIEEELEAQEESFDIDMEEEHIELLSAEEDILVLEADEDLLIVNLEEENINLESDEMSDALTLLVEDDDISLPEVNNIEEEQTEIIELSDEDLLQTNTEAAESESVEIIERTEEKEVIRVVEVQTKQPKLRISEKAVKKEGIMAGQTLLF